MHEWHRRAEHNATGKCKLRDKRARARASFLPRRAQRANLPDFNAFHPRRGVFRKTDGFNILYTRSLCVAIALAEWMRDDMSVDACVPRLYLARDGEMGNGSNAKITLALKLRVAAGIGESRISRKIGITMESSREFLIVFSRIRRYTALRKRAKSR